MTKDKQILLQFDNTTLTTSVAFINICIVFILYLRSENNPFQKETCDILVVFFTIIYLAFLISAGITVGDMMVYTNIYPTNKSKCLAYIVGLCGFSLITFVLLNFL